MDSQNAHETVESLQVAYSKLFTTLAKTQQDDAHSLAQPYPLRYVPSVATDCTEVDLSKLLDDDCPICDDTLIVIAQCAICERDFPEDSMILREHEPSRDGTVDVDVICAECTTKGWV